MRENSLSTPNSGPGGQLPAEGSARSEIDAQASAELPSKPEAQASDLDWKVDAQMGATANDAPLTSTAQCPAGKGPDCGGLPSLCWHPARAESYIDRPAVTDWAVDDRVRWVDSEEAAFLPSGAESLGVFAYGRGSKFQRRQRLHG